MPSFQSVTLVDAIPANHTFVPRDITGGVAVVIESAGVPVGDSKLSVSVRKAAAKYRSRVVLDVPVLATETINGISVPKIVRRAIANVEFVFDETSTLIERQNAVAMFASAFNTSNPLVYDTVTKLEGIF